MLKGIHIWQQAGTVDDSQTLLSLKVWLLHKGLWMKQRDNLTGSRIFSLFLCLHLIVSSAGFRASATVSRWCTSRRCRPMRLVAMATDHLWRLYRGVTRGQRIVSRVALIVRGGGMGWPVIVSKSYGTGRVSRESLGLFRRASGEIDRSLLRLAGFVTLAVVAEITHLSKWSMLSRLRHCRCLSFIDVLVFPQLSCGWWELCCVSVFQGHYGAQGASEGAVGLADR